MSDNVNLTTPIVLLIWMNMSISEGKLFVKNEFFPDNTKKPLREVYNRR